MSRKRVLEIPRHIVVTLNCERRGHGYLDGLRDRIESLLYSDYDDMGIEVSCTQMDLPDGSRMAVYEINPIEEKRS